MVVFKYLLRQKKKVRYTQDVAEIYELAAEIFRAKLPDLNT